MEVVAAAPFFIHNSAYHERATLVVLLQRLCLKAVNKCALGDGGNSTLELFFLQKRYVEIHTSY